MERIKAFASGIGDDSDLEVLVQEDAEEFFCIAVPTGLEKQQESVYLTLSGRIRFNALGIEVLTKNYGKFEADLIVCPRIPVEFSVRASAIVPIDLKFRVEADVRYISGSSYVGLTISSDEMEYAGLRDIFTAANPADVSNGATAAELLHERIENEPVLQGNTYEILRYRTIVIDSDAVVITNPDGSGPVQAYPLRTTDFTGEWLETVELYSYEQKKEVGDTNQYIPVDKNGELFWGSEITWILEARELPSDTEIYWEKTEEHGEVKEQSKIIARTFRNLTRKVSGYVKHGEPVYYYIDKLVQVPDEPAVLFVKRLNCDDNVYFSLAGNPESRSNSGDIVSAEIDNIVVDADLVFIDKPWNISGRWHNFILNEKGIKKDGFLKIDIQPSSNIKDIVYGYEVDVNGPIKVHFNNEEATTDNPYDYLLFSCDEIVQLEVFEQKNETITIDTTLYSIRPGENLEIDITVHRSEWSTDVSVEELVFISSNPNVRLTLLGDVQFDDMIGTAKLKAEIVEKDGAPWEVGVNSGFYYINSDEYYLYDRPAAIHGGMVEQEVPKEVDVSCSVVADIIGEGINRVIDIPPQFDVDILGDYDIEYFGSHIWRTEKINIASTIPADAEYHNLTNCSVEELVFNYTGVKDKPYTTVITNISAFPITSDLVLKYRFREDLTVKGMLPADLQCQVCSIEPTVDENMTVTVYPKPVGIAPVLIETQDGIPLRYIAFIDENGNAVLENTEEFKNSSSDTVSLAFTDIDIGTIDVVYREENGTSWQAVDFLLNGHDLKLPFDLEGRTVRVKYRVKHSFNIDYSRPEGGITLLVHSDHLSPGDPVRVSYGTAEPLIYSSGVDLCPLKNIHSFGFTWIDDNPVIVKNINLNVTPREITIGDSALIYVEAVVLSNTGSPVSGQTVIMTFGNIPIPLITDKYGIAGQYIPVPFEPGELEIEARIPGSEALVSKAKVNVLAPVGGGIIFVETSQSVAAPEDQLEVRVTVHNRYRYPEAGREVILSSNAGNITPFTVRTDMYGVATATLTAPTEEGRLNITASCDLDGFVSNGTAYVSIQKPISLQ